MPESGLEVLMLSPDLNQTPNLKIPNKCLISQTRDPNREKLLNLGSFCKFELLRLNYCFEIASCGAVPAQWWWVWPTSACKLMRSLTSHWSRIGALRESGASAAIRSRFLRRSAAFQRSGGRSLPNDVSGLTGVFSGIQCPLGDLEQFRINRYNSLIILSFRTRLGPMLELKGMGWTFSGNLTLVVYYGSFDRIKQVPMTIRVNVFNNNDALVNFDEVS